MITLFILFIGIIISSAFCSMAEAALLSLPFLRVRILHEEKRKNSKDLLFLKENISKTVASLVIINNTINIIGSIFIGQQMALQFGNQWLGIGSAALTFFIIFFSEIIPKMIGEKYKITISLFFAKPIRFLVFLFQPLLAMIMVATRFIRHDNKLPRVTEDEIKMMLKLGRAEGTVEMDEEVLCNHVFKLNDVHAAQIMKPIEEVFSLPANKTLEEVKDAIINCRFSRIATYNHSPFDIVGMVQQRVLLREIAKDNYKAYVRDFMMEPIFVNWFTKADTLLAKFQAYNQHLFVVQDSQGKNVGLVSMEDVLEELFGEIYDEKDVVARETNVDI